LIGAAYGSKAYQFELSRGIMLSKFNYKHPSIYFVGFVTYFIIIIIIIIIIISAERRPLLDIGLPQSSPRRSVLRCPHPAAYGDHHQIIGPSGESRGKPPFKIIL
jgi:hypothetical protein